MKQFFAFLITIICCINSNAQIQQGALVVGGTVSYYGQNKSDEFSANRVYSNEEYKTSFIAVRPKIGFFKTESLLIGIGMIYEYNSIKTHMGYNVTAPSFTQKSNVFLLNPYLIKYQEVIDKLYFTTTVNLLFGIGNGKYSNFEQVETNILEYRINITPGLTYFLSDRWAMRTNIGQLFYNGRREKLTDMDGVSEQPVNVDNKYGLSISFNTFSIGFQYLLNNKKE